MESKDLIEILADVTQSNRRILRIMKGGNKVWPSNDNFIVQVQVENSACSVGTSSVEPNSSFETVLSPNTSCIITNVSVFMGDADITSTAYSSLNNTISISEVTGDVIISVVAVEVITFADNAVKTICVGNWGGGTISGEITIQEASLVTSFGSSFNGNTSITSFNELRYFTGLTALNSAFEGCTNLTSVILPRCPLTTLGAAFSGCSSLVTCEIPTDVSWIFGTSGLNYAFMNCENLEGNNGTIDLSMISASSNYIGMTQCFTSCKKITRIVTPNAALTLDRAFLTCSELVTLQMDLSTTYGTGSNRLRNPIGGASSSTACKKLTNITNGFKNANTNLQLGYAPLTHESVLQIIDGLGTVSSATLTLSASARATLTNDEIAVATSKGWTLATSG